MKFSRYEEIEVVEVNSKDGSEWSSISNGREDVDQLLVPMRVKVQETKRRPPAKQSSLRLHPSVLSTSATVRRIIAKISRDASSSIDHLLIKNLK